MDVNMVVKHGDDISAIEREYPGIYLDDESEEFGDSYWIGTPESDEDMTSDEAEEFCGFVAAVMPDASTMIEGSGPWAMGQITKSAAYQKGYARGEENEKV